MKSHRDIPGVVINIFIAALILALIILGLNKMGLYELPDAVEKIISPSSTHEDDGDVDEGKVYDSVSFDKEREKVVEKTKISHENARKMLEEVKNTKSYRHELSVCRVDGSSSKVQRVVLEKSDNICSAAIYSENGLLLENIVEEGDNITVERIISGAHSEKITHPKGSFSVSELAGVVTSHENFLEGDYVLEEGDFSVIQGDFGIELEIVFDTVMDNYKQKEVYRINLDYGIVTSAKCYENDVVVYDMQTILLRELKQSNRGTDSSSQE